MSSFDDAILSDAIVQYIGRDGALAPRDDISAVAAAYPENVSALEPLITQILIRSETISFAEVAPFDRGLRERIYEKLRQVFPGLTEAAVEAIAWRWGFLNLR